MSLENLKEYALRCANEPELRETVKTIGVADLDGQMRYAESLGLEWTMEDMAALRKEVAGSETVLRISARKSWSRSQAVQLASQPSLPPSLP